MCKKSHAKSHSKKSHSKKSHSKNSSHCEKPKCFCLRVPYVPNPSYSVENLSENPLSNGVP